MNIIVKYDINTTVVLHVILIDKIYVTTNSNR